MHNHKFNRIAKYMQYSTQYTLAPRLYMESILSIIHNYVARRMNFKSQMDITVWESVLSLCIFILLGMQQYYNNAASFWYYHSHIKLHQGIIIGQAHRQTFRRGSVLF